MFIISNLMSGYIKHHYLLLFTIIVATGLASCDQQVTSAEPDPLAPLPTPEDTSGTAPHLGLLFEDDFASGELSAHNDYFRWGRDGAIRKPYGETSYGTTAMSPDGRSFEMMIFDYEPGDRWDEMRFHLTESLDEHRTARGIS